MMADLLERGFGLNDKIELGFRKSWWIIILQICIELESVTWK